jgi:1,3-beta-glucan synthase
MLIMLMATIAEFQFIPTTRDYTSHLTRRVLFLLVTLALMAGPTFYIAIAGATDSQLPLILGII